VFLDIGGWTITITEGEAEEHIDQELSVAIKLADLLELMLSTIVDWPLDSWTDVNTEFGDSWKRNFTREEFELEFENYPRLKPYSVKGSNR
jgi:hypothetical protein